MSTTVLMKQVSKQITRFYTQAEDMHQFARAQFVSGRHTPPREFVHFRVRDILSFSHEFGRFERPPRRVEVRGNHMLIRPKHMPLGSYHDFIYKGSKYIVKKDTPKSFILYKVLE
ncbi:MAG: hypothetical protein HYY67_08375 [Thaumarchaeota archaeon]|nr:hypothetical protein [Nitrososphaerota archaeon]